MRWKWLTLLDHVNNVIICSRRFSVWEQYSHFLTRIRKHSGNTSSKLLSSKEGTNLITSMLETSNGVCECHLLSFLAFLCYSLPLVFRQATSYVIVLLLHCGQCPWLAVILSVRTKIAQIISATITKLLTRWSSPSWENIRECTRIFHPLMQIEAMSNGDQIISAAFGGYFVFGKKGGSIIEIHSRVFGGTHLSRLYYDCSDIGVKIPDENALIIF